jgi:hypothetical protein
MHENGRGRSVRIDFGAPDLLKGIFLQIKGLFLGGDPGIAD